MIKGENMVDNNFVSYLNTLHNYNAQNSNSYGENNINNNYFQDVMVEIELSNRIAQDIEGNNPHTIILTGHAGDGKTSIMYQVLQKLEIQFGVDKKIEDYTLKSGKKCRCIKDFSEIADVDKRNVLFDAFNMEQTGDFAFMVANTGPLINTFGELFADKEEAESAKIELIDLMDKNTGSVFEIKGFKMCVINVANIDNAYFASMFLDRLLQDQLWEPCVNCSKNEYCHIKRNIDLIIKNKQRVYTFLNMHFVWLTEHGKRLTIRSMTEQLAYMLTGGIECEDIKYNESYKYLFSNLFFGYVGTLLNTKALNIVAVKEAHECHYDNKRLRADESILMNHDFHKVFGKEMDQIIIEAEKKNAFISGWAEFLRRTYIFANIVTDEKMIEFDYEDIFSRQYRRYLMLRNGKETPSKMDSTLVCDALSMIYVGTTNKDQMIPLTLSRSTGIVQNVQLIIGTLTTRNIKIVRVETKESFFNGHQRYSLKLKIDKHELKNEITLPLINYFEELKNGIISTNVDPQLSHGIESLKAELADMVEEDNDIFEMIILRNNGTKAVNLEITADKKIREQ